MNDTNKLLEEAYKELENLKPERAEELFKEVLTEEPANARAHLGKVLIEFGLRKASDLQNISPKELEPSRNWERVQAFADLQLQKEIHNYFDLGYKKGKWEIYKRVVFPIVGSVLLLVLLGVSIFQFVQSYQKDKQYQIAKIEYEEDRQAKYIAMAQKQLNVGSFTDERDQQQYNTIQFNNLIWMLDNLQYGQLPHYAANGDEKNNYRYGLLYNWDSAQKACPEGWRLPTKSEFETLKTEKKASELPHRFLKDLMIEKAGYLIDNGQYDNFEHNGVFWSSTISDAEGSSEIAVLNANDGYVLIQQFSRQSALSVRCVKEAD